MNYSTAIFLINKAVRAIRVSYDQDGANPGKAAGNLQLFKSFDTTLAVGDYVIVPTDTRWKMTVCRIEEVDVEVDLEAAAQVGWLVGRADRSGYDAVVAEEEHGIAAIKSAERRRKQEELVASLLADNPDLAQLQSVRPNAALPNLQSEA